MDGRKRILLMTVATLWPLAASAAEHVLILHPDKTTVTFRVKASGHDIEGTVAFAHGQVRFDPDTGAASGEVTIDVRRAQTGNRLRDWEMHRSVLEIERFPVAVFRPNRLRGWLSPAGASELVLEGLLVLHGAEHTVSFPVKATRDGDSVSAEAVFEVPYVSWGLHDPSFLFLRVAPSVAVTVKTEARIRLEGGK